MKLKYILYIKKYLFIIVNCNDKYLMVRSGKSKLCECAAIN